VLRWDNVEAGETKNKTKQHTHALREVAAGRVRAGLSNLGVFVGAIVAGG